MQSTPEPGNAVPGTRATAALPASAWVGLSTSRSPG